MAITIPVLVILAVALALPNYLAVRYAVLGGGAPAVATGVRTGRRTEPARAVAAASAPAPRVNRGVYMWKALSPLLFAVCLVLGIGVGGAAGAALAGAGLLNLVWGVTGWR